MFTLPQSFLSLLKPFASVFSGRVFEHVKLLAAGAILAPGKRTITSALRILGLSQDKHFQNYHRVLSRDKWPPVELSRLLLVMLVNTFVKADTVLISVDPTLERRRGRTIKAKGVYHDSCRSSRSFEVKSTGLRWIVASVVTPIGWAGRLWALPFMSVLAPSRRFYEQKGRAHRTGLDRTKQIMHLVHRWIGQTRKLVWVFDSAFSSIEFLHDTRSYGCAVVPLRMDAALHDPVPARPPGKRGRSPKAGPRQKKLCDRLTDPETQWSPVEVEWYGEGRRTVEVATGTALWTNCGKPVVALRWVLVRDPKAEFEPRALACPDQQASAKQILEWFISRWPSEVTYEESRAHMGVESQRQHSDPAIARTTPVLFGLYSLVALYAAKLLEEKQCTMPLQNSAWYQKSDATFCDTLAFVREELWNSYRSPGATDMHEIPQALFKAITQALCYPA